MKKKIWDEIVLTKDAQGADNFAQKIGELILTLLKENEVCKIYNDDGAGQVFIIEHGHDEHYEVWGCPELIWVEPKDLEMLYDCREGIAHVVYGDDPANKEEIEEPEN
mgnify:CR=1 FL=1